MQLGNQALPDHNQTGSNSASAFLASDSQGLLKHQKHLKDSRALTNLPGGVSPQTVSTVKKRKHKGEDNSERASKKEGKRKRSNHGHER